MNTTPTGNRVLIWKVGIRKKNKQLLILGTLQMTILTKLCDNVREIFVTMVNARGSRKEQFITTELQPLAAAAFVYSVRGLLLNTKRGILPSFYPTVQEQQHEQILAACRVPRKQMTRREA